MRLNSSSIDNEEMVLLKEEKEEETVSLYDLPKNNEENQSRKESPLGSVTRQEEFDFCSCTGGSFLNNSVMCTADEVLFQGQMLPLRYSNNLPSDCHDNGTARSGGTCNEAILIEISSSENYTQQIRMESMEHCHYSINSSITSTKWSSYKPQILNQFHSQPSPTPQIQFSKITHKNINSSNQKLKMWSLFRVGLVTTPEIALQDLKIRWNKNFNITQNTSSSSNDNRMRQQRSLQRKKAFLGSCKCSVETVPSKVVTINNGSTNCKRIGQASVQSILHDPRKGRTPRAAPIVKK